MRLLKNYCEPWQFLLDKPQHPQCFLGGNGRFAVLGLAAREVEEREVFSQRLIAASSNSDLPFERGYIGLLSYDQFAELPETTPRLPSRYFWVDSSLVFDQQKKQIWLTGMSDAGFDENELARAAAQTIEPSKAFAIAAREPESAYLEKVGKVIEEIRAGRFYQLNLLRYFQVSELITRQQVCSRLRAFGGPFSAWLEMGDLSVVSFSPERFLLANDHGRRGIVETFPIKGTRPRVATATEDATMSKNLLASGKDRAELSMIIDLMRNDLQRVSEPRSITVADPGSLVSYQQVHHLVGAVTGQLRTSITLGDLFKAVCPGGSITGAPKREVMKAIAEYEQRPRGYFMGNVFSFDVASRRLDSSILIRTLVSQSGKSYEFAAGSGIVVKSDASAELAEINDKCKVLTGN
jgi:para-aminobenzoate synthetase component 1